jgi:hypothetical protein
MVTCAGHDEGSRSSPLSQLGTRSPVHGTRASRRGDVLVEYHSRQTRKTAPCASAPTFFDEEERVDPLTLSAHSHQLPHLPLPREASGDHSRAREPLGIGLGARPQFVPDIRGRHAAQQTPTVLVSASPTTPTHARTHQSQSQNSPIIHSSIIKHALAHNRTTAQPHRRHWSQRQSWVGGWDTTRRCHLRPFPRINVFRMEQFWVGGGASTYFEWNRCGSACSSTAQRQQLPFATRATATHGTK